ncbi:hypothetical protein Pcinc_042168 [Petrolisthes cinctipes]|uniref:SCP domain-containing protein n=1 Tax=Petrolisthes cinctipes TaxID=88211 RepID=A0AAE1BJA5_PETCI|nr:hypothetical protein Pcinc_042168 [Petrolisthes cinctipes]
MYYSSYWSYNLTHVTTTTTTTTTTTPPPPPQSFAGWTCENYRQLTTDHTMCKSTPSTCAIYRNGITSHDRLAIVIAHNEYRAKVARGEEGEGLPGPQYSSTDMQELTWNEELARVAQAWASACPDYHDCHDCRKILSKNITNNNINIITKFNEGRETRFPQLRDPERLRPHIEEFLDKVNLTDAILLYAPGQA